MSNQMSGHYCPYCHGYIDGRTTYYPTYPQQSYNYVPYPTGYWYQPRDTDSIIGKASWTWGGVPTKCEIGWKYDNNMTVAVAEGSPFKCGQRLKVRNLSFVPSHEVIVTVVDTVKNFPLNKINLHRMAFEALGAQPSVGVLDVEITPI
ncbi:RlpA-like double-psi beta-barrel domain-containing protein [Fredinandcohnia sp. 179-A 10B2 NHS]|uniref:RlpA-like double-psi beta-barrel domain-containing protein n=1 Tax=Fredinandcohnia sp. 179-A 10B2 NHS TaxID=3235176 RepID=UPI0039A233E8